MSKVLLHIRQTAGTVPEFDSIPMATIEHTPCREPPAKANSLFHRNGPMTGWQVFGAF